MSNNTTKKDLINKLHNIIINYDNNLKNKNVIFILENTKAKFVYESIISIETLFNPHNFYHLTGIKYNTGNNENFRTDFSISLKFYKDLLKQKVSLDSIEIKNPYLTSLKLQCLEYLSNIDKSAKFVGDFDGVSHNLLYTEKIVGNISYCFGFVRDDITGFYVPNSSLQENIKNITNNTYNILAIMKKDRKARFYEDITYIKNGLDLNCLLRNNNIAELINFENLNFSNKDNVLNTKLVENFKNELNDIVKEKTHKNSEKEEEGEEM